LTFGRSIARAVVSFVSYWLIIPNLIVAFTKKKQSVADMVVGSTVVSYRPANGVVLAVVCLFFGIAIIGILAAIAIPQYQDYVVRARATEAHADLRRFAALVEQQWRSTGRAPESLSALGYSPNSKVATFAVMRNGFVTAELPIGASKASLWLRPSYDKGTDTMSWKCFAQGWTIKSQRLRDCEYAD
jgi:type IV pilus assembly protein PilA